MTLMCTRDYRLRWMDFDRYGRIEPAAVLDIFQDIATIHANEIGIGRDEMIAQGVFWAVVRQKYEIVREPEYYQVVTVRSWPHTPTRASFLRDYTMSDEQGELLVKATSEWVLVDVESRKLVSAKDRIAHLDGFVEDRCFERKPRKLPDFDIEGKTAHVVMPLYADIDLNGHVNNAMYGNYVVNALNPGKEGAVRAFQIDYRHEALFGEPLSVYANQEEGRITFKGVREDGAIAFAAAIDLA